MRIAHVMAGAPAGGAELFFERLTVALAGEGDDVLPVIRTDTERAARLRAGNLSPLQFRFGGPLDLVTGLRLRGALRRFAPRVTVAWMKRAAHFCPTGDWALAGRLGGFYDLSYFSRCDHLIGITQGIVDWITAQGWPSDRAHYLPNFVPDMAGAAPAALGVPEGSTILLGLGRLHRNKAFDVLIRALPRLPSVRAVIAGDGPERAALESLARRENVGDRVSFIGWRHDTSALLAACDLFVCPSRHEPHGNVILEAWSASRPVIASAIQGPAELISNGENGVLTAPDDPAALACAIEHLLDNPEHCSRLASAGRRHYQSSFAEAHVIGRWRNLLANLQKT